MLYYLVMLRAATNKAQAQEKLGGNMRIACLKRKKSELRILDRLTELENMY